jgi:hypothetical protein
LPGGDHPLRLSGVSHKRLAPRRRTR